MTFVGGDETQVSFPREMAYVGKPINRLDTDTRFIHFDAFIRAVTPRTGESDEATHTHTETQKPIDLSARLTLSQIEIPFLDDFFEDVGGGYLLESCGCGVFHGFACLVGYWNVYGTTLFTLICFFWLIPCVYFRYEIIVPFFFYFFFFFFPTTRAGVVLMRQEEEVVEEEEELGRQSWKESILLGGEEERECWDYWLGYETFVTLFYGLRMLATG